MRLCLLRHAEAAAHEDDAARELTELGWAQAQAVAEWLAEQADGRVAVIASPLLRAQQTAGVVQQALALDRVDTLDALVPEGDILQAEHQLSLALGDLDMLVVVSHMPLLATLASWLEEGVLGVGEAFSLAEVRVFDAEVVAPGICQRVDAFRPEETTRALSELVAMIGRF